jgi:hypothetical protein
MIINVLLHFHNFIISCILFFMYYFINFIFNFIIISFLCFKNLYDQIDNFMNFFRYRNMMNFFIFYHCNVHIGIYI